jgi:hypothetical protein
VRFDCAQWESAGDDQFRCTGDTACCECSAAGSVGAGWRDGSFHSGCAGTDATGVRQYEFAGATGAEQSVRRGRRTIMKNYRSWSICLVVPLLLGAVSVTARAGWLDTLKQDVAGSNAAPVGVTSLTQGEMYDGLKQALSKGVQQAVANLGHDGGYLNNLEVKIPMPDSLKRVQQAAHAVGQDKVVDDFIATMNHAAEQAVPQAAAIFGDAITKMNVDDAKAILTGPDDAATQYFRKTSEGQLTEKMLPIVKQATAKTGVTAAYKQLMQYGGSFTQFMGQKNSVDLDGYVTGKALDGLFKMVAAEEKNIRENPVARSTDLLKKVFGAKIQ